MSQETARHYKIIIYPLYNKAPIVLLIVNESKFNKFEPRLKSPKKLVLIERRLKS